MSKRSRDRSVAALAAALEREVAAVAHQLAGATRPRRGPTARGEERFLSWMMAHPAVRTQLFRLVDVFPAADAGGQVPEHLEDYLAGAGTVPLHGAVALAARLPFGDRLETATARRAITRMARRFIAAETAESAAGELTALWRRGIASTVDVLGEKTVCSSQGQRYARRADELLRALLGAALDWPDTPLLDHDDLGSLARVNLSVKPSALSALYAPLTRRDALDEVGERLRPLLRVALAGGAHVTFDMEHYGAKDLTLELFHQVASEEEFVDLDLGIALQAYLHDTERDLRQVIERSRGRRRPLSVRLVKGAYWDTEVIHARAQGWPIPVFEQKAETDANYERLTGLLLDHHGEVRASFASHNLRSLAVAIVGGRQRGIPLEGLEIQMLRGMGEDTHEAVRDFGLRLRVYSPVGELVPGMAYLVRRLLENTANESFVRARSSPGELERVLAPLPAEPRRRADSAAAPTSDARQPAPYRNESPAEWHRAEVRSAFASAVRAAAPHGLPLEVPARIDGRPVQTAESLDSVDPGEPSRVVARSAACGPEEAEEALAAASAAARGWRQAPPTERAGVLFGAAAWMRRRRDELAALEVYEAGKPWVEADLDVCEAIDYLEYYGRRMLELAAGGPVESPPGERNVLTYAPLGTGVVIAPWNFPLAIPTGMVAAALITGNTVVLKPAEQTPAIAARLVEALAAAGLPDGVLAFLPGRGEVVGSYLVEHPDVAFVAFTGSKAVGLSILETAAVVVPGQRQVKRVVAEMGGKNALIVDSDADLDQAVPIAAHSAFGYSGQKCSACSRLIVVGSIHDELIERLVGATCQLRIGHPAEMGVQVGPLIDEETYARVSSYAQEASHFGAVALAGEEVPGDGWFVAPTIVTGVDPTSELATEEIFGPVLAVMTAASIDEALAIANLPDYALTGGIVSRSPRTIASVVEGLRAGNVYVNRTITGAVVGRQPFGGAGLSGAGAKAGGPDYLQQFLQSRLVSENTVRQGFAPLEDDI